MSQDSRNSAPSKRPGPPGGKRDRNRKKRIEALHQAGLALFLERGVEAVTVDDIASRAGMAKGNFYRYFQNKEELVSALMERVAEQLRSAMRECGDALAVARTERELFAAYETLARKFASVAIPNFDVIRLYLQERRSPAEGARGPIRALADEVAQGAVRLTEVAVEHDLLRVSDPRISAWAVVGAVEELALAVMHGELDLPPDQIADTLIGLVLDGIRAR